MKRRPRSRRTSSWPSAPHSVPFFLIVLLALGVTACAEEAVPPPAPPSLIEMVEQIEKEIAEVRGLDFLEPVRKGVKQRDELEGYLLEKMDEEFPDDLVLAAQKGYIKLGLLPEGLQLKQLVVSMLTEQIAGFYDTDTQELYILADFSPVMQRLIISHELTHALQDQHFGLESLPIEEKHNDDLQLAVLSIVEGDAINAMRDHFIRSQGAGGMLFSMLALVTESFFRTGSFMGTTPTFEGAPPYLSQQLIFLYLRGSQFVDSVELRRGRRGVDDLFRDPPVSSEQIMHPHKYLGRRDPPIIIALPDLAGLLDDEAAELTNNVLGEFGIGMLFSAFPARVPEGTLRPPHPWKIAAGWGGDRYCCYEDAATGRITLVWFTTWDTEREAVEFEDAYNTLIPLKYDDARPEQSRFTEASLWRIDGMMAFVERVGKGVLIIEDASWREIVRIRESAWRDVTKTRYIFEKKPPATEPEKTDH